MSHLGMSGLGPGMVPQLLGCAEGLPGKEERAGLQTAGHPGWLSGPPAAGQCPFSEPC